VQWWWKVLNVGAWLMSKEVLMTLRQKEIQKCIEAFQKLIMWIIKLIGKLSEKRAWDLKCAYNSHDEMKLTVFLNAWLYVLLSVSRKTDDLNFKFNLVEFCILLMN
jgi:hypothetical protein